MLDGIPISSLTPAALVSLTVLLLLLGKLVPRSILEDKIREATQWREAYEKEREARRIADAQTAELLEVTRTTKSLIEGVFRSSELIRESGDQDVPSLKT